ncbi:MAG: phosphate acyltransferase PlsX [Acidimicrobiales bacterium]
MAGPGPGAGLPVAVDAMGGDRAPQEIVAGARRAAEEHGLPVLLVGQPDALGDTGNVEVLAASEVIGMDEDPGQGVRRKKDSSLVRAAEAVRDGQASAMVSAGNTGAAMASALLRMGRLPGVARPAIATPLPIPGSTPLVLIDAGANAECSAPWLVQFAQMGAVFAARRYGVADPRVALLSIGEEPTKGTPLVKEAHALLAARPDLRFVGNVEGRDLMTGVADVVVTDGFTGNVALKTLEGGLRFLVGALTRAMTATDEARRAAEVLLPGLAPVAAELDPDSQGGAMLVGVEGVCIISHGSSSSSAVANAIRVAHDLAAGGVVEDLRRAVAPGPADAPG